MTLLWQEEFTANVKVATSLGYRCEVHAIGDKAAEVTLNAWRDAKVTPEKRSILTHCQVILVKITVYELGAILLTQLQAAFIIFLCVCTII